MMVLPGFFTRFSSSICIPTGNGDHRRISLNRYNTVSCILGRKRRQNQVQVGMADFGLLSL